MEKYIVKLVGADEPDQPTYTTLGISKERADILDNLIEIAAHDRSLTVTQTLAELSKHAETINELVYMSFGVGTIVYRMSADEIINRILSNYHG